VVGTGAAAREGRLGGIDAPLSGANDEAGGITGDCFVVSIAQRLIRRLARAYFVAWAARRSIDEGRSS
jgi:hypothetical protein